MIGAFPIVALAAHWRNAFLKLLCLIGKKSVYQVALKTTLQSLSWKNYSLVIIPGKSPITYHKQ